MNLKLAGVALLLLLGWALSGCQSTSISGVSNGVTAGDITVNFQEPANFTDVRESRGGPTAPAYLDILARHLKESAPAFLRTGQRLTVTFTDIDLAGDFSPRPQPGANDIRIIKDLYRPRMKLTFAVRDAKDRLVKDGARVLQDLDFQFNSVNAMSRNLEPLHFDKELLTDWLQNEFPPPPARRRSSADGVGLGSGPGSEPWLQGQSTNRGSVEEFRKP